MSPEKPIDDVAAHIPVRVADVTPFAKRKCNTCDGTGVYNVRFPGAAKAVTRPCGCALRRFSKVQKTTRGADGRLFFAEPIVAWSAEGQAIFQAEADSRKSEGTANGLGGEASAVPAGGPGEGAGDDGADRGAQGAGDDGL